jgi:large subunit ribosomal protein L10
METKIKNFGKWCREKIVEEMVFRFKDNANFFITEFSGLKVNDIEGLRKKLGKGGGRFLVVKKSLATLAFKRINQQSVSSLFNGQTSLVMGGDDPALISKTLVEFGKNFPGFQIKGGLFNGEFLTLQQIKALSQLPPRPVLLGKVCSALKSPLYRLVSNFGLVTKFVLVLKQIEKTKGEMKPGPAEQSERKSAG